MHGFCSGKRYEIGGRGNPCSAVMQDIEIDLARREPSTEKRFPFLRFQVRQERDPIPTTITINVYIWDPKDGFFSGRLYPEELGFYASGTYDPETASGSIILYALH